MKGTRLMFVSFIFFMALSSTTAFAFRCGHDLVEVGDFKYKVLRSCGEPISKEVVAYGISPNGECGAKVEHWVYGPKSGWYTVFIFRGGIVAKIVQEPAK